MSVFIGYPSFMAYQMMKGKKGRFPSIPGMIARYSALGLTNEQMAENPVWKDLTGNGHDLQMKNFAWGEMSGVGGYTQNYNYSDWMLALDRAEITKTGHSFNVTSVTSTVVAFYYQSGSGQEPFTVKSQIVRVIGLTDGQSIKYGTGKESVLVIESDGIYTLPPFDFAAKGIWYGFSFGKIQESCNITLEQLPYYPGFIIGDGVDDYAVTEKNLDFEDTYTVYTAFIPFQEYPERNMVLCGKNNTKDFYMNYSTLNSINFYSSSKAVTVPLNNGFNLIICKRTTDKMIIKNLLTNVSKEIDANAVSENPGLYYLWGSLNNATYANAAIAGQTICNGYFSTDEDDEKVLDWYKKQYPWLFFDQAWTVTGKTNEDKDRATIANITGNGNNLILSNFGFAEGSGYGLYNIQKFTNWNHVADRGDIVKNGYSVTITNSKITGSSTNYNTDILYSYNSSSTTIIFKVTGLVDGQKIFLSRKSVTDAYVIDKDGIYHSDYNIPQEGGKVIVGIGTVGFTGECNITIEQIPEYEGYLVTDGVDDKIVSSSFGMGKDFTVVGEWTLLQNINVSSLRKQSSFIIRNNDLGLSLFINRISHATLIHTKSLRAFCSNGVLYKSDWTEQIDTTPQDITSSNSELLIASHYDNKSEYDKIAFKNLAIYPTVLSKDDCIKAYNYLQTLKAK